ncbi:hypothetical protein F4779DRAFT_615595 [Xylariaceae sp. FL0662B]|nr:hypothetical protein F4779DRAFT_615595 [Xylariaceae sp. FL0662B]
MAEEYAKSEGKILGQATGILVLEALKDLQDFDKAIFVDVTNYKFRLLAIMETHDQRVVIEVDHGMGVGNATRKGAEIMYEEVEGTL